MWLSHLAKSQTKLSPSRVAKIHIKKFQQTKGHSALWGLPFQPTLWALFWATYERLSGSAIEHSAPRLVLLEYHSQPLLGPNPYIFPCSVSNTGSPEEPGLLQTLAQGLPQQPTHSLRFQLPDWALCAFIRLRCPWSWHLTLLSLTPTVGKQLINCDADVRKCP